MRFRPHRLSRRRASAAFLTVIAVASGAALTAFPASAAPLTPAPVHGSAADEGSTPDTTATPANTEVSITVVLTPGDRDELRSIATSSEVTDAGDVNDVAPSLSHAPHVRAALEAAGFTVDADADRWDLTATGTAAQAERLFDVHLVGTGETMHPTTEPVMPASFGGKATTVLGLDQRPVIAPTAVPGTPASTLTGAYGATGSVNAGAGATVATVQFSGWNASDLKTYAKAAGKAMPSYTQVSVDGASTSAQSSKAGAFEVALDQQSILAVAPKAAQRAYFAANSVQGMYDAYSQVAADVAQHGITTVSVSWLMCEPQLSADTVNVLEDAVDRIVASGATMFAASGDNGAKCVNGQTGVGYPASSPAVLSVGGTTLTKSGNTYRESTWGNQHGATGGGISSKFSRPGYQAKTGISSSRRQTPDIAAIADPAVGPGVYSSVYGQWMLAGGTSLASPILAAELASTLSNRGCSVGIGDIHTTLYGNPAAFRDITTGGNGTDNARRGYDLVTGLGSPNWATLKNALPTVAGCQQRSPIGSLEAVSAGRGTATVRGWTYDNSDSKKSLTVKVTVGGTDAGTITADAARADVNKAKKVTGGHGFAGTVKTNKQGEQQVCVTAMNVGAGTDSLIGCSTANLPTSSPEGAFDSASGVLGGVNVSGWAFDRDDLAKAVPLMVIVGGKSTGMSANTARADINRIKQVTGDHGFTGTATTDKYGKQRVCITALNVGVGESKSLGCKTVTIPDPSPVGTHDGAAGSAGAVTVHGWSYDPNRSNESLTGYVTVGGTNIGSIAMNGTRTDVNKAKKITGQHGFNVKLRTTKTGNQSVCVIAKNVGSGSNRNLGCRATTIGDSTIRGSFDGASASTTGVTVRGWTYDTSAANQSINVTATVDGESIGTVTASGTRDDVNRVKKISGRHGFNTTVKANLTPGKHTICVIGRNIGAGGDADLGCKTVAVTAPTATPEPTQPAPSPTPTQPAPSPTPSVDPNAMPNTTPTGWTRTFGEDFTTSTAAGKFSDTYGDRFVAYDGFNDTSGAGKYSADALSAKDGVLNMRMHTDASGQPIGAAIIPLVGGEWGGQTEARYDIRLRADNLPGYGVAGLLWSDTNTWTDGEIDFPEGALDGGVTLSNHCPQSPAENCLHKELDTAFTSWHTYTVERTSTKLTFLIDGKVVASTADNLPTKPLHFVLQAATHSGAKPAPNVDGNVQVAWVTVSQPTGK
jgi:hypothetical protein